MGGRRLAPSLLVDDEEMELAELAGRMGLQGEVVKPGREREWERERERERRREEGEDDGDDDESGSEGEREDEGKAEEGSEEEVKARRKEAEEKWAMLKGK